MTTWTKKSCLQGDLGYLLTDTSLVITTDNNNRLLFHNWNYYCQDTVWVQTNK